MAKKAKLSARELFDKLAEAKTTSLMFAGMIKPAENDDTTILFARANDCTRWVPIPTSQIENIEFVQMMPCRDHQHPFVKLFLKQPESAEGRTFAALAGLPSEPVGQPHQLHHALAPAPMLSAAVPAQPGATPCYFDFGLMRWRCPPWS
jgi:hypothetical protein